MSRIKLSPPWVTYYYELDAFFKNDPTIHVVYDEDNCEVKLYCEDTDVADALTYILPAEKIFGNVTLKVTIIPANKDAVVLTSFHKATPTSLYDIYACALSNNESVRRFVPITGIMSNPILYVIFKPEIVQYWTDDLSDAHGVCSTLMQNIARDIFENQDGVFFCTDLVENAETDW